MIHLQRPPKPIKLTEDLQTELTEKFKADKNQDVWNKSFLRTALLDMSHGKCCYCETRINEGPAYMHIDHFKPKSIYPDEVVNWDNLFPACGDCNSEKTDHDTVKKPILNPCEDDPRQFFYLSQAFYKSIDRNPGSIANLTINVLDLNDLDKKCKVRYKVMAELVKKLDEIALFARANRETLQEDTITRNKVIRGCRDLLKKCIPEAEFSAFNSTALHHDADYEDLKQLLQQEKLWTQELEDLDNRSRTCVFRNNRNADL